MTSARKAQDKEIAPRIRRSDDADAWGELVRRFAPYVHAVAHAHHLPETDAESVFEEVFVRLWTQVDTLAGDEAIRSWIVELTTRLASDHHAALRPAVAAPSDARMEELHRALILHEALRRLPATQREIVQRRLVEGQDEAAIAGALGISADAVTAQSREALQRLRGQMHGERRRSVHGCTER